MGKVRPYVITLSLLAVIQLAGVTQSHAQVDITVDEIDFQPAPTPGSESNTAYKAVPQGLSASPNPFSSDLHLQVPEGAIAIKVSIYNDQGDLVHTETVGSMPYTYTISELGAGLYDFVVETTEGIVSAEARKL